MAHGEDRTIPVCVIARPITDFRALHLEIRGLVPNSVSTAAPGREAPGRDSPISGNWSLWQQHESENSAEQLPYSTDRAAADDTCRFCGFMPVTNDILTIQLSPPSPRGICPSGHFQRFSGVTRILVSTARVVFMLISLTGTMTVLILPPGTGRSAGIESRLWRTFYAPDFKPTTVC